MSTNAGSGSPNEHQMSGSPGESSKGTNGKEKLKLKVIVDADGNVVGNNAKAFQTRAGDFVRAQLPISYPRIKDVPPNFKDDVWNALMSEFELDVPEDVAREAIEPTWSQKFRSYKNQLRTQLKNYPDMQPKGIDPLIWKKFLDNERDPKKIAERLRNSENRKKLKYSHTLGRQSYAQKQHILAEGNLGKEVQPEEVWLVGHKRKDGTALPSAQPQFNALAAESKKRKKDDSAGCSRSFKGVNKGPMGKVFGPHKRGGIRGKGTYLTKKRFMNAAVAKAKLNARKDNEIASQRETINKLTSELAEVKGMLQVLIKKFLPTDCATTSPLDDAPVNKDNTPSADQNAHTPSADQNGSTSNTARSVTRNLVPYFASRGARSSSAEAIPRVNLRNKFGKKLARGYIVTDLTSKVCHFRKVKDYERKVWIEEVFVPDEPVYDGPQNGNDTLAAYVCGGYIVWPLYNIEEGV